MAVRWGIGRVPPWCSVGRVSVYKFPVCCSDPILALWPEKASFSWGWFFVLFGASGLWVSLSLGLLK